MQGFTNSVTKKGQQYHQWMDFLVFEDLPFDRKRMRKIARIDSNTFKKYFRRTGFLVCERLKKSLPPTFGIIFDGIFSIYDNI